MEDENPKMKVRRTFSEFNLYNWFTSVLFIMTVFQDSRGIFFRSVQREVKRYEESERIIVIGQHQ